MREKKYVMSTSGIHRGQKPDCVCVCVQRYAWACVPSCMSVFHCFKTLDTQDQFKVRMGVRLYSHLSWDSERLLFFTLPSISTEISLGYFSFFILSSHHLGSQLGCLALFLMQSVFRTLSSYTTTPDSVTCLCWFNHSQRGRGMASTFPEARHKGLWMDWLMARGTKPAAKLLSDTSLRDTQTHS